MKLMLAACMVAAPAWGQPFDCAEARALAESAGAFVAVVNDMTSECQGKAATDQTCRAYVEAIKRHDLPDNLLAFSAQAAALAVRCPD
ncbi:hypothetical protein [Paracoccus yeei]|uniref:hypothetical protein n=1 Tax=Paracoccus yeei TaxID=147645 RepID=UPI0016864EF4|nr:hypothetical protein [Paracoccus yeei]